MYEIPDIHLSLDDARRELKRRWEDVALRKAIEEELGEFFMPQFREAPRATSFRQLCTPDHGFTFFEQASRYVGAVPLVLEYHDDLFVSLNEEKKALGRLRVVEEDGTHTTHDIMAFHEYEKKTLGECRTTDGVSLVDFHHTLFKIGGYETELLDNSAWFKKQGSAKGYYYRMLLHFICHSIWFENIEPLEADGELSSFMQEVTYPAILRIKEKYNIYPLVIRQYPLDQDGVEDFYWWSYPKHINTQILNTTQK